MNTPHHLIYVLYDSITNSVFTSQIYTPLCKKIDTGTAKQVLIISFETHHTDQSTLDKIHKHPQIHCIIIKRAQFLGQMQLKWHARILRNIIKNYTHYAMIARGPYAGYTCMQAVNKQYCTQLTIQVRGLLTEEYEYVQHNTSSWLMQCIQKIRAAQLRALERYVYTRTNRHHTSYTLELVSSALQKYLITTYGTNAADCTIAQHDIPPSYAPAQVNAWRTDLRAQYNIPKDAYVYCYSGSAKKWQCPHTVISFFIEEHTHNKDAFLLILTNNTTAFSQLLAKAQIKKTDYRVLNVSYDQLYHHLAMADVGLLFREKHPMNLVARPTKVLEYRAVGLPIIHNSTVAWLTQMHAPYRPGQIRKTEDLDYQNGS